MPAADRLTCPLCRAENAPGAAVCQECGRSLGATGALIADRYEVLEVLGRGGMGVIFRARDRELDEVVAVKTLRPGAAGSQQMVQRLRSEIRLARRVRHKNVCAIHEFGEDNGVVFVVMDFIDGQNVSHLIAKGGGLPLDQAFDISIQACRGLAAIHEAGIVHRDFKPSNLMLDSRGVVRVLDFGIAKAAEERDMAAITQTGQIIGTPDYMSPEQATGKPIDTRSDLFSFGCVVFELFSGERPYKGDTVISTIIKRVNEPAPLTGPAAERIPAAVRTILGRLLAREPDDRFSSATQVVGLIQEAREIAIGRESTQTLSLADVDQVVEPPRAAAALLPESLATVAPSRDWTGQAPATSPAATAPAGEPWQALERALPGSMRRSRDVLLQFFETSFKSSSPVSQGLVRLHGFRLGDVGSFQFFALLIAGDSDPSTVGTQTFIAYASPLESQLASLPEEVRKVVVVVTESHGLGGGVRQKIREYRQRRNALVVPLILGEIRTAAETRSLRELLKDRLDDYHSRADVFASRGALSDPTTFFGMRELLNELVGALQEGDVQPVVCGPPGSGKTSVIKMAHFDMIDTRFLTVRCANVVRRTPACFVHELARSLRPPGQTPGPPLAVGKELAWEPQRLERVFEDAAALCKGSGHRPVIVLEDADWLIEALCRPPDDPARRAEVQELWTTMVGQARDRRIPLVITSVQGFLLGQRRIGEWDNPIAKQVRILPIPPLTRGETGQLASQLGRQMNVTFDRRALDRIYERAAGNIDLTRRLCSTAIAQKRDRWGTGTLALAQLDISSADVKEAADELAADPRTFEPIMQWLDEADRGLLRLIAEVRPRGVRELAAHAPKTMGSDALRRGTEKLHELGLVHRRGRRERPFIPIFEEWLRRNFALPEEFQKRRSVRKTRWIAAAVAVVALVLAGLGVWKGSPADEPRTVEINGCNYRVYFPASAVEGSEVTIRAYRTRCTAPPARDDKLRLLVATSTNARVADNLVSSLQVPFTCAEAACAGEARVKLVNTTEAAFRLSFADAPTAKEIAIDKDRWAKARDLSSRTLTAALGLLGTLSSLVAAFDKLANLVHGRIAGLAGGSALP